MAVTFENCKNDLLDRAGSPALKAYQEWQNRPGYEKVVEFVEGFNHKVLFELKPCDVLYVMENTEHALGDIRKENQIKEIENFTCPFALQHIFHRYIENAGRIPTWQQFSRWIQKQAYPHWLEEIQPLKERLLQQYSKKRVSDAIQWRLGKFYYSALRELDLLVWLRAQSLDVKYHLLSDVLLRVDFWIDDLLICIYFPNKRYRDGQKGRKPPAEYFFNQARPPFRILDFPVERQGFGRLWLVSDQSKQALAERIKTEINSGG